MWWTQPKLALVVVGTNALVCFLVVIASDVPLVQVAGLVFSQAVLLIGYSQAAHRLGAQHLDGKTEAAFEANVWNKRWNPSRDTYSHSPDLLSREGGGSFYQQVLGDTPTARRALYRAMSMWEGARLLWAGNTVALGAAIGSSTVSLAWAVSAARGPAALIASAVTPVCVLLLPEAINIMLLKRSIVRHGAVQRAAVLVPRDAVDLGLKGEPIVPEGFGREFIVIMSAVFGIPLLLVVGLAAGLRAATLTIAAVAVTIVAAAWAFHAFLRLLVSGIPFLNFGVPVEVSVLLDLAHRQRAYLSLSALIPLLYLSRLYFTDDPRNILDAMPIVWLGYLVATTFGDQLSGYAGFFGAARFKECFNRSLAKVRAATS